MSRIVEHIDLRDEESQLAAPYSYQHRDRGRREPPSFRPAKRTARAYPANDQPWRHYKPPKRYKRQLQPLTHLVGYLALYGALMTLMYITK